MTRMRSVGWMVLLAAFMTVWGLFVSGCVPGKSSGAIGVTPAVTQLGSTCAGANAAEIDSMGRNDCAVKCAIQLKRISSEASAYWGHAGLARGVVLIGAALIAILAALAFHRVQAKLLWPRYPRPAGAAMLGLLLAVVVAVVVGVLGETFWVSASLQDFRKADLDLIFMKDKLASDHAIERMSEDDRKRTAPSCYDVFKQYCEQQENSCFTTMNKDAPYSVLLGPPISSVASTDAQVAADWKLRQTDVLNVLKQLHNSKSLAEVQQRNTEVDIYYAQPVLYKAAKRQLPWWSPVQDQPVTWAAVFVMMHGASGALGYALLLLGMWVWYRTAHMSEAKKY